MFEKSRVKFSAKKNKLEFIYFFYQLFSGKRKIYFAKVII